MFRTKKTSEGFTLIELLVVITIIGILSAIVYANFNEARDGAKNRAWQTELKEVQLAIELYKAQNGSYPAAQTVGCAVNAGLVADSDGCSFIPVIDSFVPDFISELPDPADSPNPDCNLIYEVDSATEATWYKLSAVNCMASVDATSGTQETDELARCPETCSAGAGTCSGDTIDATYLASADFYESLAVYSAGGQCE